MKTDSEWYAIWKRLHILYSAEQMEGAIEGVSPCGMFKTFAPIAALANHRNDRMADWLEDILMQCKKAYYNSEEPIMSDPQYDKFEGNLRLLRSGSEVLSTVGALL